MKSREPIKTRCRNQMGLALLLASFSILFVSLLVIAFLEVSTTDLQILDNFLQSTKALYVADAGVEHKISELRQDKNHSAPISGSVSTGDYSVGPTPGQPPKTITSTGTIGSFQRKIVAVVTVTGSDPYNTVTVTSWKEVVP